MSLCIACKINSANRWKSRKVAEVIGYDIHLCMMCKLISERIIEEYMLECYLADQRRSIDFVRSLLNKVRGEVEIKEQNNSDKDLNGE